MIRFDLNGMAYETRGKTRIGYADELPTFLPADREPAFQWPEWAIRHMNTLLREGFPIKKAMGLVRREIAA